MRALHQRFFHEPECVELSKELESIRSNLRDKLDRQDREKLMKLVDLEIELREETSLASFIAGFQLAFGIARELRHYSFEDEEEQRACDAMRDNE